MFLHNVKPFEIWFADLPVTGTRAIHGLRPVLVIAIYGNLVSVVPLTSTTKKQKFSHHIAVGPEHGLLKPSSLLTEQLTCIDKSLIRRFVTRLPEDITWQVKKAIISNFGLLPAA